MLGKQEVRMLGQHALTRRDSRTRLRGCCLRGLLRDPCSHGMRGDLTQALARLDLCLILEREGLAARLDSPLRI